MSFRNLSPQRMFEQLAAAHKPLHAFEGGTKEEFEAWKAETIAKVLATLGDWPERVPPRPELVVEWEHDGLRKQRWLIDVGEYISSTVQVNTPASWAGDEKLPTLMCWHGHGGLGKEPVMGNDSSPAMREQINAYNYNYGHRMAKKGFVTYAIEWMGMGEHNETIKPNFGSQAYGRDWCNLYYLHATMLGMTSVSINTSHGMAATDFVCTLPQVDPDRLGVMGLSGGGTMTMWTALTDERFKAAEIICYLDLWEHFGIRHVNYCGMQVTPGLYKLVDLPDLQGLIAPKPLLIDIGVHDTCFLVDTALAAYRKLETIYAAADASDRLELDLFPGEHSWGASKSEAFFRRHLGK